MSTLPISSASNNRGLDSSTSDGSAASQRSSVASPFRDRQASVSRDPRWADRLIAREVVDQRRDRLFERWGCTEVEGRHNPLGGARTHSVERREHVAPEPHQVIDPGVPR
jgi:hypothetical protein